MLTSLAFLCCLGFAADYWREHSCSHPLVTGFFKSMNMEGYRCWDACPVPWTSWIPGISCSCSADRHGLCSQTFPNSQFLSRSEYWLLSGLLKENNLALNSIYLYVSETILQMIFLGYFQLRSKILLRHFYVKFLNEKLQLPLWKDF